METLYRVRKKQDLTVAQIMNPLLLNSDLNRRKWGYIIAQNASFEAAAANFTIPDQYRGRIRVLFENRLVENRDGKFTDSFSAAGTHVYCIPVK